MDQISNRSRTLATLVLALFLSIAGTPLLAQEAREQTEATGLVIGVHESPPFVIKQEEGYTGMAIRLWEFIAGELNLTYSYKEFDTVRQMIDAAAASQIDVAVTNLTITEARATRIEFTQPWFDSGLRIMVNENGGTSFWNLIEGLYDSGFIAAYGWLALIIIVASIGFTIFDRRFDKNFPKRWRDGLAESFYLVMTIATSGKPPSRKNLFGWVGRVWQGLWLVFGIVVVAFVTSSVTSVMTTLAFKGQIRSVADLPGLTIGVTEGSTAEDYAQAAGLTVIAYPNITRSARALVEGDVQAVIGDKPVLEYHAHVNPDMPLKVVGAIFNPDKYGFGLPPGSPIRKPMTIEIVGAREDGTVRDIAAEYFGLNP
ncbi:MAG: ABC transporter substrate-binding protein [Stappia sp.]|uniref:transporter substrate-binding domain-containing protein n=1 Tax=Stappia sp. TaxID=1870903 RepID=UPI000C415331|nr:transporter substrate-binding domain-containing protein [Stappia sp.]MAB01047.1 ABC transporter substrate-binding protein [Stappia sp.]MBM19903.1 ABC transporter substrate-binding protein [Stappia sp.]